MTNTDTTRKRWAIQTPPENDEQYRHHQKTMTNIDTTYITGVLYGVNPSPASVLTSGFLVVSVLLIVFWWCLYCSSFSGGVCIGHRFLEVCIAHRFLVVSIFHQKTMSNTDTTRKR
jgi:ABC-type Mn2+/Zn2+ transport system permease subunit